jgi:TRAP-type mannitol/chloroaromatic compound transport system permease small subunit
VIDSVVALTRVIDRFTDLIGRLVSWLTVVMVLVVLTVVITRYFMQVGSIALQESVTYLHSAVFLMGIAYTLQHGGHVRVDIFYRNFSARRKAIVDTVGGVLFLLPVTGLIFYSSWDYVMASWAIGETSAENNGLPFIYLLKTLMLLMPGMLFLQGLAEIFRNGLLLTGNFELVSLKSEAVSHDETGSSLR